MLTPNSFSYWGGISIGCSGRGVDSGGAHLGKGRLHHLRPVVDGQDDIRDADGGEGLDLVQDHGPVAELDEGLGEGKGLWHGVVSTWS